MRLAEFLQDADGALSSTRLAFLAWVFGILGAWGFSSVQAAALQPVPDSVLGLLGLLMTGKVVQSFGEKK